MAGVAIFDSALVAYPLYKTSKHILATREFDMSEDNLQGLQDNYEAADRWLTFWLTFGLIELFQGFGGDTIPGFHMAKAAVLLSLYSVEHATLIGALMPRVCASYIQGADRAKKWLNDTAVPQVKKQVQDTSWVGAAQQRIYGLFGWNTRPSDSDVIEDDEDE